MEYIARVQQKELPNHILPYPYFITGDGFVGRQDFWKGRPYELLGFNDIPEPGQISLPFKDFKENTKSAIGKYPVFRDKNGSIKTHTNPVDSVTL